MATRATTPAPSAHLSVSQWLAADLVSAGSTAASPSNGFTRSYELVT